MALPKHAQAQAHRFCQQLTIVVSDSNSFESAGIFLRNHPTRLTELHADILLTRQHKWIIYAYVLVQGQDSKRLHFVEFSPTEPCKSDDLKEHIKEQHEELLRAHKNNVICSGFAATLRKEGVSEPLLLSMIECCEEAIKAA